MLGFGVFLVASASASASSTSIGLGFNYSRGERGPSALYTPAIGVPAFGYGAGAMSLGAIGGACGMIAPACNTGCMGAPMGPGMMMPGGGMPMPLPQPVAQAPILPPLPAPAPVIAPHMMGGWGGGYGAYPSAMAAPAVCGLPCGAGLVPMSYGPVAGGPAMIGVGGGSGFSQGASSSGGDIRVHNGSVIEVGGKNAWEINDSGDIAWSLAVGLGMQATNVYPITPPRYAPTTLAPSFYGYGDRDLGFIARPHGTP